jgi:hypothetical protein
MLPVMSTGIPSYYRASGTTINKDATTASELLHIYLMHSSTGELRQKAIPTEKRIPYFLCIRQGVKYCPSGQQNEYTL